MPLYEYQCDACSHRFEAIQKFSDAPITTCPKCGSSVRKLIASPAFQFKGTGWYITDYAKKDAGKEKGAEANSSSEKSTADASEKGKSDKSDKADTTTKSASSSTSSVTPSASPSSSKE